MALSYKNDEDQDARLNPAAGLSALENQTLKDIDDNYDSSTADPSQEDANIRRMEAEGGWVNNTGKIKSDYGGNKTEPGRKLTFANVRAIAKKRGSIAAIVTTLGIMGIGGISLLSPSLLLMNILSGFTNNFNDAHVTISTKTTNAFARKIANKVRPSATGECDVACRSNTFSEDSARNLEKNGFEVKGETVGDRRVVTEIKFPDNGPSVKSGDAFKETLKNPSFAAKFTRAANTSVKSFITKPFRSMLAAHGLSKYFGLDGSSDEKFKESFRESIGLPESTSGAKEAPRISELRTKLGTVSGRVSKITGAVGAACLAKDTSTGITAGLKYAQYATYAAFAMPFFVAASKTQADGIDPGVMSHLGDMLTATDNRKTLPDGSANEMYGLSATDSYGYKAAMYGDNGQLPAYAKAHVTGPPDFLGAIVNPIAMFTPTPLARNSMSAACKGASSGADLALECIASAGVGCAIQIGAAVVTSVTLSAVIPKVIEAVIDANLAKVDENTVGAAAGDLLYPGAAVIFGGQAANYGLRAGTPSQIKDYTKLAIDVRQQDDNIARVDARNTPLDVYNKYSFLGSMASSLNIASMAGKPLISSMGSIVASMPHAFASLIPGAQAATYEPLPENKANLYTNNSNCAALTAIGVGADNYCMPSYITSPDELNDNTDAVISYMTNGNYIDPNTGAARTDTPGGKDFQKYLDNCVYRTEPLGETSHAIEDGDVGDYEWYIGARCQSDDTDVKNFRMYTMDDSVNALVDNTDRSTHASADTAAGNADANASGTTANSGNVNPNGWTFPTTAGAPLVSPFGPRGSGFHTGVDLGVPSGSPFYASRDGVVQTRTYNVYTINNDGGAWCPVLGQISDPIQKDIWITSNVDGQTYTTVYAHLSQFLKKSGDTVKAGDLIGYTGGSGCSSGPHVHFEIWKGAATPSVPGPGMLDPWPLISK